jgi:hypothetical protein
VAGAREVRTVSVLEKEPEPWGFSVSPGGRWILFVLAEEESDIMLVDNLF